MTPPDPIEAPDAFEQRLAAIPHRELPPEWRTRILSTARAAERIPWSTHLAALLWPHPLAWGALVTGWLAIAALNFTGPRGESLYAVTPATYRDRLPSAQEYLVEWETERRLIALLESESVVMSVPRPAPFHLRPEDL